MNGYDKDGNQLRCNSCGSFRHLQADCQHRFETYYESQDFDQNEEQVVKEEAEPEEVYTAYNTFEVFAAATIKSVCLAKKAGI